MTAAATNAVYVDYKRIKTRKVHQIVFEVPSETWPDVYKVLGEPDIDGSRWFAVAAMEGVQPVALKGGALAQKAGIMCNEGAFEQYAIGCGYNSPEDMIYSRCNLTSRAHLDHDEVAASQFKGLCDEYQLWLKDVA